MSGSAEPSGRSLAQSTHTPTLPGSPSNDLPAPHAAAVAAAMCMLSPVDGKRKQMLSGSNHRLSALSVESMSPTGGASPPTSPRIASRQTSGVSGPSSLSQAVKPSKSKTTAFGLLRKVRAKKNIKVGAGSHEGVLLRGYLYKEGGTHKSWKHRWCVLADMALYYYKTPNDEEALGSIPLPGYTVERARSNNTKFQHMFKISHANVRTWYFAAETGIEAAQWCDVLRKIGRFESVVPVVSVANDADAAADMQSLTLDQRPSSLVSDHRPSMLTTAASSQVVSGASYGSYTGHTTGSQVPDEDPTDDADDDADMNIYDTVNRKDSIPSASAEPFPESDETDTIILRDSAPEDCVTARALFDNEADDDDELIFNVGDEICIINRDRDDWWIGTLDGKTGLVYAAYVAIIS